MNALSSRVFSLYYLFAADVKASVQSANKGLLARLASVPLTAAGAEVRYWAREYGSAAPEGTPTVAGRNHFPCPQVQRCRQMDARCVCRTHLTSYVKVLTETFSLADAEREVQSPPRSSCPRLRHAQSNPGWHTGSGGAVVEHILLF